MAKKKTKRTVTLVRWKIVWADDDIRSLYKDNELYLHRTRAMARNYAGPNNDVCRVLMTVELPAKARRK